MTRIKYTKVPTNGSFGYRTTWLTVGPNIILCGMIAPDNSYRIVNAEFQVLEFGTSRNLRQAKELIRNKLIFLGLNLDDEIRTRK